MNTFLSSPPLNIIVALLLALSACRAPKPTKVAQPVPGIALEAQSASGDAATILKSLGFTGDRLVLDDTWAANPDLLLGKIIYVTKDRSGLAGASGHEEWGGKISFAKYAGEPTKPVMRSELLISRDASATLGLLDYAKADAAASAIYHLVVTDQATKRLDDRDEEYQKAIDALFEKHRPQFEDVANLYVFIVEGYTYKTIHRKAFSEVTAGFEGGGLGLRIGSKYYSSDLSTRLDYAFELSLRVLKRPSAAFDKPTNVKPTDLSKEEAVRFSDMHPTGPLR